MLNKPRRASPAQTCMKCKMRKTKTQTCRNICGESVLFYLTLFMLFEADFPKRVEKRKKWRREEHLKMHLQLFFHLSFFPLESRCRLQSLMFPPPIHKKNSFQLMNLWHRTHPYALTHALSSLQPYLNTKPYKPLSIDVPQPAGSECGLWHTPCKCTHSYTLSIVMNDPLRAELSSWDHFLALFFFLWPFTLVH